MLGSCPTMGINIQKQTGRHPATGAPPVLPAGPQVVDCIPPFDGLDVIPVMRTNVDIGWWISANLTTSGQLNNIKHSGNRSHSWLEISPFFHYELRLQMMDFPASYVRLPEIYLGNQLHSYPPNSDSQKIWD